MDFVDEVVFGDEAMARATGRCRVANTAEGGDVVAVNEEGGVGRGVKVVINEKGFGKEESAKDTSKLGTEGVEGDGVGSTRAGTSKVVAAAGGVNGD